MSAVIDRIEIPLTKKQDAAIRKFWQKHTDKGRAMLAMQPLGRGYCSTTRPRRKGVIKCAVIDHELAYAINQLFKLHKKERP